MVNVMITEKPMKNIVLKNCKYKKVQEDLLLKFSITFIVDKITSIFKEYSVKSFELEDCSLDLELKNLVKGNIESVAYLARVLRVL